MKIGIPKSFSHPTWAAVTRQPFLKSCFMIVFIHVEDMMVNSDLIEQQKGVDFDHSGGWWYF